jgi:hypothetical protein
MHRVRAESLAPPVRSRCDFSVYPANAWRKRAMTEAAAIVSALDDDPSLRGAQQSLIRCIGLRAATLGSTQVVLTENHLNAPSGSNGMDPPLSSMALMSQNGCDIAGNYSPRGGRSHGTADPRSRH